MYTMKEVCNKVGMTYEALRFYCNQGLVPDVKRDDNNYRVFDERCVNWIESLQCLKKCGMSIKDMKNYMNLCLRGAASISERKDMLAVQRELLIQRINELNCSVAFIDRKQEYFDSIMTGKLEYTSNLIDSNE